MTSPFSIRRRSWGHLLRTYIHTSHHDDSPLVLPGVGRGGQSNRGGQEVPKGNSLTSACSLIHTWITVNSRIEAAASRESDHRCSL